MALNNQTDEKLRQTGNLNPNMGGGVPQPKMVTNPAEAQINKEGFYNKGSADTGTLLGESMRGVASAFKTPLQKQLNKYSSDLKNTSTTNKMTGKTIQPRVPGGGFGLNMSKGGGGGPVVKPLSLKEAMANADTRMSTNTQIPIGPAPTDAAFVGGRVPTQFTTGDITQGAIDSVNTKQPALASAGGGFNADATFNTLLDSVGEPLKSFKNIPLNKINAAGIRAITDAIKTPEQAAAFRKLAEEQVFADGAFAELNKSGTYQMPDNKLMIEEGIKNDRAVEALQKAKYEAAYNGTFGGVGKTPVFDETGTGESKQWGDTDKVIAAAEKRYDRYIADKKAEVIDPDKKRLIDEITAGIGSEKKSFDPARFKDDIYENTPGDYSGRTDLGAITTANQEGPATGTVSTAYQEGQATGTVEPMNQRIGLGTTPSGFNVVRQGNSYSQSNLPTDQQKYTAWDSGKGMFGQNVNAQRPEAYPQQQVLPQQVDPRDLYDMLPETSRDQDFMSYFRTLGDRKKMMKLIQEAGDQNAKNQEYALGLNKLNSDNIQKDLDRRADILMKKYGLDRASAEAEVQRSFTADQNRLGREQTSALQKNQQAFTGEQNRLGREQTSALQENQQSFTGEQNRLDRESATENAKIKASKPMNVQTQGGSWVNRNDPNQIKIINDEIAAGERALATGKDSKGNPISQGQREAIARRLWSLRPKSSATMEDALSGYAVYEQ